MCIGSTSPWVDTINGRIIISDQRFIIENINVYKTNIEKLIIQLERRLNDIFKDIEIEQLADVSDDIFELIKEVNLLNE